MFKAPLAMMCGGGGGGNGGGFLRGGGVCKMLYAGRCLLHAVDRIDSLSPCHALSLDLLGNSL